MVGSINGLWYEALVLSWWLVAKWRDYHMLAMVINRGNTWIREINMFS